MYLSASECTLSCKRVTEQDPYLFNVHTLKESATSTTTHTHKCAQILQTSLGEISTCTRLSKVESGDYPVLGVQQTS